MKRSTVGKSETFSPKKQKPTDIVEMEEYWQEEVKPILLLASESQKESLTKALMETLWRVVGSAKTKNVLSAELESIAANPNKDLNKCVWDIRMKTKGGSRFFLKFHADLKAVTIDGGNFSGDVVELKLTSDVNQQSLVYEGDWESADWGNTCRCDWDLTVTVNVISSTSISGTLDISTSQGHHGSGDSAKFTGKPRV